MRPKKRPPRVVTGNARRDRLPPVSARRFVMEGDGSNQQFSWLGVRLWKAKRIETPRRSAIARTPDLPRAVLDRRLWTQPGLPAACTTRAALQAMDRKSSLSAAAGDLAERLTHIGCRGEPDPVIAHDPHRLGSPGRRLRRKTSAGRARPLQPRNGAVEIQGLDRLRQAHGRDARCFGRNEPSIKRALEKSFHPCVKSPGFNPSALTAASGSDPHASTFSFGAIIVATSAVAVAGSPSATK